MRFLAFLAAVVAGCSGRSPDAGPTTTSRDPAGAPDPGGEARLPRPLDAAVLDALATVSVGGRAVTVARRGTTDLAAIVAAPGGPRVTVTASACLGCTAMILPAWEARRAELAALWAPAEAAGDSLVLAAPTVAGRTVIAVDARRTLDGERRHTYQLHWNDGAAQLAAVCETSAPAADAGVPPPDGCAAEATAALAAYLTALGG